MHVSYLQFRYSCIKLSGCKSHHYINLSISRNNTCMYVGTVMYVYTNVLKSSAPLIGVTMKAGWCCTEVS